MVVASAGVTLNALVAASLLTSTSVGHRRAAASFIIHACLLDSIKSVYCVLFAVSSLEGVDPSVCDALSRFVLARSLHAISDPYCQTPCLWLSASPRLSAVRP